MNYGHTRTFTPFSETEFLQVICIRQERKAIAKEKEHKILKTNLIKKKLVWQEIISGPRLSKAKHALGANPSLQVFNA